MSKGKKQTFFHNTYQEESLIGEGSYGKVYKAKSTKKNSEICAIKNIKVEKSKQEVEAQRGEGLSEAEIKEDLEEVLHSCEAEIKLMHDLKGSSNIVNIEDYEVIKRKDGYGFEINIRMELLERLESYYLEKSITNHDILKLGLDISKALKDCNGMNIIHRDIKPDNIFVNKFGDYKLGDFGIARNLEKTTSGLSQKGTFNYIAPEVYKGDTYNKSVDIYSLGLVLYKYFNYSRLPFLPTYPEKITVSSREEAVTRRTRGDEIPAPVNATEEESKVILKMIAYNKEDRYKTPEDVMKDLEELLEREERLLPKIEKKETKVNTNLSVSKTEIEKQKSGIEKTKFNKKLLIPIPIILILISIAAFTIYQKNNYILVPNLLNEESTKALEKLDTLKLKYKVEYKVVEESKVGKILSQDIKGKKIKKDKVIKLTAGISDEKVEMIGVVGLTQEEATKKLESLGLKVSISEEYSEEVEKGKILSQMTEKGTKLNKGTVVELLVSKGKEEKKEEQEEEKKEEPKKENKQETKQEAPKQEEITPEPSTPTPAPTPTPTPTVFVNSIAIINLYDGDYYRPGQAIQATLDYYPSNADNLQEIKSKPVTWTSSNPSIATVSNGYVQFKTRCGTTVITATVGGLTDTATVYVPNTSLSGDLDGNNVVDANDASLLGDRIRANNAPTSQYDYTCDGRVDNNDVNYLLRHFIKN